MLNKSVSFGILSLFTVLFLANSAIAQQDENSPSTPAGMTNTMPQQMGDQRFITMMIHHDQKTLKMADLAIQKAKNPQIKALATQIKMDQTQEIEKLQALYKQLYGSEVPANTMNCMGMGQGMGQRMGQGMGQRMDQGMGQRMGQGMGGMMSLESLENSPNFDQEFVQRMIHHQQMSVNMASKAAENANVLQIRNLAQAIIKTQTAQIQQLQQLSPAKS